MNYLNNSKKFNFEKTKKILLGQILNQQEHYQDDDHLDQSYIQLLMSQLMND